MMRLRRLSSSFILGTLTAATIILTSACGPVDDHENESDLSYGLLSDHGSSLMNLVPGDTIFVCGSSQLNLRQHAINSARKWAEASSRTGLRIVEGTSCANRTRYKASIMAGYGGSGCTRSILGYHTQSGQHHDIVTCPLAAQGGNPGSTMLHEVGHAYGMCDQYAASSPSTITFHGNCRSQYRSATAQRSIMGGGYRGSPTDLTEDDLIGIRIYACRADVAENAAWIRRNPNKPRTWKTANFMREIHRLKARGMRFMTQCTTPASYFDGENPESEADAPTVDTVECSAFTQQATLLPVQGTSTKIPFRLSMAASSEALRQVASVSYPVHASLARVLEVTSSEGGFATGTLLASSSGWLTSAATVKLQDGRQCQVDGTLVQ